METEIVGMGNIVKASLDEINLIESIFNLTKNHFRQFF